MFLASFQLVGHFNQIRRLGREFVDLRCRDEAAEFDADRLEGFGAAGLSVDSVR